ncbi:hypothetical protein RSAG8_13100, partial [Rhizoctonia solani AG-8 WAC10335]
MLDGLGMVHARGEAGPQSSRMHTGFCAEKSVGCAVGASPFMRFLSVFCNLHRWPPFKVIPRIQYLIQPNCRCDSPSTFCSFTIPDC